MVHVLFSASYLLLEKWIFAIFIFTLEYVSSYINIGVATTVDFWALNNQR